LSLVAGAPQSFIQPLSQPLYVRRPEIPIATEVQTTPQTHEAGENSGSGELVGIVTDQTGAVIRGAVVTVTDLASNVSQTRTTSSTGLYDVIPLASGRYKLTVRARGFLSYIQNGIAVQGLQTARADVRLTVGSETQTVTVESDALAVQTDSNVVSTLISSKQIAEIPSKNRN